MDQRYQKPRNQSYGSPQNSPIQLPSKEQIRAIVVDGNVEMLVDWADKIGKSLYEQQLSTNQIRNVFGTARQIQLRWDMDCERSYRDAILLIPKLGYFAEREKRAKANKSEGMETLQKVLEPALRMMTEPGVSPTEKRNRFVRIMELFEAIVAYHKKYGGK